MRLWRLTRAGQTALDGAGTVTHGGRYSPPGSPVVNFASEAGLAVLVALRYLQGDPADAPDDYVLGWTEIDAVPERAPDADNDDAIRDWVTDWLEERRSLLAAVRSQVLPEADVVLMNPLHPEAGQVPPLVTRPFSFAECLHTPPMLARLRQPSSGNIHLVTLRERFLRWWRPAAYYETHPLSEDERRAIAHAADGVGQAGMRGSGEAPFGRPSIPDDDGPRR